MPSAEKKTNLTLVKDFNEPLPPLEVLSRAMRKTPEQRAIDKAEFDKMLKKSGVEFPHYTKKDLYDFDDCTL